MSAPFDIKDFLQGRRKPASYIVFMKHFIKCITKKTRYEANLKTAETDDDICTASDEAFALLLVENCWEKWYDMYDKDPTSLLPRRGGRQDSKYTSPVPAKYTKGGYRYADNSGGTPSFKTNKGWSPEGLTRYNVLFDFVEADRKNFPEFAQSFIDDVQATKAEKKKPATRKKTPSIKIRHNLFKYSRNRSANEVHNDGSDVVGSPPVGKSAEV